MTGCSRRVMQTGYFMYVAERPAYRALILDFSCWAIILLLGKVRDMRFEVPSGLSPRSGIFSK